MESSWSVKPGTRGESIDAVALANSKFTKLLTAADVADTDLVFYVFPDSFRCFINFALRRGRRT